MVFTLKLENIWIFDLCTGLQDTNNYCYIRALLSTLQSLLTSSYFKTEIFCKDLHISAIFTQYFPPFVFTIQVNQIINHIFLLRPQALAWEVRKQSSPGKNSPIIRRSPSPGAMRFLNFGSSKNVSSWADCLKGIHLKEPTYIVQPPLKETVKIFPSPVLESSHEDNCSIICNDDDNEGWEVVRKGRVRSKTSSNVSSTSSKNNQLPCDKQKSNKSSTSTIKMPDFGSETFLSVDCVKPYVFSEDGEIDDVYADLSRETFSYDLTDDDLNKKIKEEQEKVKNFLSYKQPLSLLF